MKNTSFNICKLLACLPVIFILFSFPAGVLADGPEGLVNAGDTVVLRLGEHVGDLHWQHSADGEQWEYISEATNEHLQWIARTSLYFRAEVIAGSCEPFYSDTILLEVSRFGTVMDIDSNFYRTTVIGEQEWMAENLKVTHYSSGEPITDGLTYESWEFITDGVYGIYPYDDPWSPAEGITSDEEMVEAYGLWYNWHAVKHEDGICPMGWRVPDNEDWDRLVQFVMNDLGVTNNWDDTEGVGNKLKSCRQINTPLGGDCDTDVHPRWEDDDYTGEQFHGTDGYGFSGLPAGARLRYGHNSYKDVGWVAVWWSTTADSEMDAYRWHMTYASGDLYHVPVNKNNGHSVRCVRDLP